MKFERLSCNFHKSGLPGKNKVEALATKQAVFLQPVNLAHSNTYPILRFVVWLR